LDPTGEYTNFVTGDGQVDPIPLPLRVALPGNQNTSVRHNDYIEQAMITLQNKKGKKRFLMPFTKQWDHQRESR
jgi:hypothetical protein